MITGLRKGGGVCSCVAPGESGHGNRRQQLFQCYLLPVSMGSLSSVLAPRNFQSWAQAQKSEMAVLFNKDIGLLGKWCHNTANGAGFVLFYSNSPNKYVVFPSKSIRNDCRFFKPLQMK